MAGSYRHIADKDNNFLGTDLIDDLGDANEALEECYDMIEYLSGGDKSAIFKAHVEGHLKKRYRHQRTEARPADEEARYWS